MQLCNTTRTGAEYLQALLKLAYDRRVPLAGSFNLTERCNFDCVHCYLGPHRKAGKKAPELKTEQWVRIIDQVTEAGCLELLITGGEPLLRADFSEIYRHAISRGLRVILFTNGLLVDDHIVGLLTDLPPHHVEVTVYGAFPDTQDRITQVPGTLPKVLASVQKMLNRGIRVKLKTMLLTSNCDEFGAIRDIADRFGISFRFDAALFARLDGNCAPLSYRVSAEEAVDNEFGVPSYAAELARYFERYRSSIDDGFLYECGAGVTSFHVDSRGTLWPCIIESNRDFAYDLVSGDFEEGWTDVAARVRRIRHSEAFLCAQCEKRFLCGLCPAFSRLEGGSPEHRSEYLCALGEARFSRIEKALT